MSPNFDLFVYTFASLLLDRSLGRGKPDDASAGGDSRLLRAGLITCGAFVIFENTINDRVFHGGWNVEWVGILALLGSLGYVGISRAIRNDQRLRDLGHELATARRIQGSILPRQMPSV